MSSLLEQDVKDFHINKGRPSDYAPIRSKSERSTERWDHDVAERLVCPRIVCDPRSEEVVVRSALQALLVEIEDLHRRVRDDTGREHGLEPPPLLVAFVPRRQFLYPDVGVCKKEWRRQIVPGREATKEDQMEIVPILGLFEQDRERSVPSLQDLTVMTFDADVIGAIHATQVWAVEPRKAHKLSLCCSFCHHVPATSGLPKASEQCAIDGKMQRERFQSAPACHATIGFDHVIKECHASRCSVLKAGHWPPTTMGAHSRFGVLEGVRI